MSSGQLRGHAAEDPLRASADCAWEQPRCGLAHEKEAGAARKLGCFYLLRSSVDLGVTLIAISSPRFQSGLPEDRACSWDQRRPSGGLSGDCVGGHLRAYVGTVL